MDNNYLPKENPTSPLPKTLLNYVWPNRIVNSALGLSDNEARSWFASHPMVQAEFIKREHRIAEFIKEMQGEIAIGLRQVVHTERCNNQMFMDYVAVKQEKRKNSE